MTSDAARDIEASLSTLAERVRESFRTAKTEPELRAANAVVLGKKGELTAVLKRLGEAPAAERRAIGERVNGVKKDVERAFEERLAELHRAVRDADLIRGEDRRRVGTFTR